MTRRRMRLPACIRLIAALLMAGCGHTDNIVQGVRRTASVYQVASVMPACGCATFAVAEPGFIGGLLSKIPLKFFNKSLPDKITLIARLDQREVGRIDLVRNTDTKDNSQRIGFDWAGSATLQHYEIAAYVPGTDANKKDKLDDLRPVGDYLYISQATDVSCEQPPPDCKMNRLGMDKAITGQNGVPDVGSHERGASYASDGAQIRVAASLTPSRAQDDSETTLSGSCGCVLLKTGSLPVTLNVTLSGTAVGSISLSADCGAEIAYDWAGTRVEDAYVMSTPNGDKARDYVTIVGQLDRMACSSAGANAMIPHVTQPLLCQWYGANMYQVLKQEMKGVPPPPSQTGSAEAICPPPKPAPTTDSAPAPASTTDTTPPPGATTGQAPAPSGKAQQPGPAAPKTAPKKP